MIDRDGDAANNGTGFGKPAKDLSINYVPVPYPDYPPAIIQMRPGEHQLWRVLNASAITYLNLAVLFNRVPQPLELVAMDGVPMSHGDPRVNRDPQTHLGVPPGARVEFIVTGPAEGQSGLLVTRPSTQAPAAKTIPTGCWPRLSLRRLRPSLARLCELAAASAPPTEEWLGDVAPVRVRRLYFSEKLAVPDDPTSAVEFYLTVDGQEPKMFDMNSETPKSLRSREL